MSFNPLFREERGQNQQRKKPALGFYKKFKSKEIMEQRARIETAFEIARVFVFGSNWRDRTAWCCKCGSFVPMVTSLDAATLDKTTGVEIFRRAEAGELHYNVTDDGALLICLSSLLETSQRLSETKPVF